MNAAARPDITLEAFEAGTLDPDACDHASHVYVGWLYLERYSLLEAIRRYSTALRSLTKKLGVPEKYNETITWFFLVLIAERRETTPDLDWFRFRARNDDLFHGAAMLGRYYNKDLLMSDRARRTFVLPDRLTTRSLVRTGQ